MEALRIEGLVKRFGERAVLAGIDLAVPGGELLAILGASGSGKTTLLRLIAGFERASAGTIRIGGVAVEGPGTHLPPERRRVGYVAQDGALFPHLSVGANVVFGLAAGQRRDRLLARRLLERVGLPAAYADQPPQHLSGGEQQRVALARALAPGPKLVLLDEPFSALDASLREQTRRAVAEALAAAGATGLLVTHDQAEALSMGHRVAVLRDGTLAQVAEPTRLYRQPVDPALARFVGDAMVLAGTVAGGRVTSALGEQALAVALDDGPVWVLLRPEQLHLGADATQGVQAVVKTVTYYGHDAQVGLSTTRDGAMLIARVSGHATPRPGDVVGVDVDGPAMVYPRHPDVTDIEGTAG